MKELILPTTAMLIILNVVSAFTATHEAQDMMWVVTLFTLTIFVMYGYFGPKPKNWKR